MELLANCKINLGLRVVRRRSDGFHDIETVMIPVPGLADTIRVAAPPPNLPHPPHSSLKVTGAKVDCPPEQNICMRALRLVQREFGIGEASLHLRKVVPSGAGLGGGSSDAAFTLRALNEVFALGLSDARLETLAAELGSDVPFFIRNTPQLCTGRGEIMTPVEVDLAGKWLVILKPETVSVSTAEAYAGITPCEEGTPVAEIIKRPVGEWRGELVNDFEEGVFARHPEIAALKSLLYDEGAVYASMSGSGSAVFGIFDRRPFIDIEFDAAEEVGSLFFHLEEL